MRLESPVGGSSGKLVNVHPRPSTLSTRSIPSNSTILARRARKPCRRPDLRRQWSKLLNGLSRFGSVHLLLVFARPKQMTLRFTLTDADALAFTERYLRDSDSHQAMRTRARWSLPCLLVAMASYYAWRDGLSVVIPIFFGTFGFAWWIFYPRRFDARVRTHAKKQMEESSYSKNLGPYELQLLDEHLHSTSPIGSSTYAWTSVDRVTMDADYLYIFLSGPLGYPIRIAEVGQHAAQRAYSFVSERISFLHYDRNA